MKKKKFTYGQLSALWNETFPNTDIVFSMYDFDEETDELIPEVDFLSETPIKEGSFKLSFNSWGYPNDHYETEGADLTWKKLVRILDSNNDGHHIFLEEIEIKGDNVIIFLGS